jgi:hypothetical protein
MKKLVGVYYLFNEKAINILINNKINWYYLSYDYQKNNMNFQELGEEIISKSLHPKRIFRLYDEDEVYNNYFDDD